MTMIPYLGQRAVYTLTSHDAEVVNRRRQRPAPKGDGMIAHVGVDVAEGDACAADVVGVPTVENTPGGGGGGWVDLQVRLNGNDVLWKQAVPLGDVTPGTWRPVDRHPMPSVGDWPDDAVRLLVARIRELAGDLCVSQPTEVAADLGQQAGFAVSDLGSLLTTVPIPLVVDCRTGAPGGEYRMSGACLNCGAAPLTGLFTAGEPTRTGVCPVCGCREALFTRLAPPLGVRVGGFAQALTEPTPQQA